MIEPFDYTQCITDYAKFIANIAGTEAIIYLTRGAKFVAVSAPKSDPEATLRPIRDALAHQAVYECDGLNWVRATVRFDPPQTKGYLYFGSVEPNAALAERICRGVEEQREQFETIESLAMELGNRYEELNLLYGIDDTLIAPESPSAESTIGAMLENCLEFLDLDGSAIHIAQHRITLYQHCAVAAERLQFAANDSLGAQIYKQVLHVEGPLILNGDDETGLGIENILQFKLMAAPIYEGSNRIVGILCFLRALSGDNFSTSDQKTCIVLASEVSKALDARYDAVTGLLKRDTFEKLVEECWTGEPPTIKKAALVQIDLDGFSLVNGSCGHSEGDRLLRESALLIQHYAPEDAIVTRFGADEFGVFLPGFSGAQARDLANAVVTRIRGRRFISGKLTFDITTSIGITELTAEKPMSEALTECNLAGHMAKDLGGNRVHVYSDDDEPVRNRHVEMQMASRLRTAIDNDEFEIYAQPIKYMSDPFGPPAHLEVLLRLFDEQHGTVSPAIFIPAAERYGLIERIDRLVVAKATALFGEYQCRGIASGLSINLSGPSICSEGMAEYIVQTIEAAGVKAETITFEITETSAIANMRQAVEFIDTVAKIGCRFSLDDFGSGMSSYAYLRQLPVDYVKIDGSFVQQAHLEPFDRTIVESVHQISRVSGKQSIAEYVASHEIMAVLKEIGIDYVQGDLTGCAMPLEQQLKDLLFSNRRVS